jgi:hypothetical protein
MSDWSVVANLEVEGSYTDTTAEPATTYEYRVVAINDYGQAESNFVLVTTGNDAIGVVGGVEAGAEVGGVLLLADALVLVLGAEATTEVGTVGLSTDAVAQVLGLEAIVEQAAVLAIGTEGYVVPETIVVAYVGLTTGIIRRAPTTTTTLEAAFTSTGITRTGKI